MLNRVLEFISKSGDFSTISIANNLGISESMAEDMKDRLIRMGYVEKFGGSECSSESCKKCSCGCGKTIKLDRTVNWKITKKGSRLVSKIGGKI